MAFPWAIVLAVSALSASALQTYQQIRKAKRLQREASELDIRDAIDDSGANIPITYGTTVVRGLQCYIQIGNGITQAQTDALNASGLKFGGLERRDDEDKREYLIQQWVLSVGGTRGIKTALINGTPVERSQDEDGYSGLIVGESKPDGGVSAFGVSLASSDLYPAEIDANSKFTGLAYATTLAWNRRGSRPRWGGPPIVEYIQEGRAVLQPSADGTGTFSNAVPDAMPANNLVACVYDYLVSAPTGPKLDAATRIDAASFGAGWRVAQRVVQGTDTATDDQNDSDERTRYQDWITAQGIGGVGVMAGVSGLRNTSWDTSLATRDLLRYEFNGSIPSDTSWQEAIVDYLLSGAPGVTVWLGRDGRYRVAVVNSQVPRADQVTLDLTAQNIELDSLRRIFPNLKTRLNTAAVQYSDREQTMVRDVLVWPPRTSDDYTDYIAEDGRELGTTIDSRGITSRYHAAALARTAVRLSRRPVWELEIVGRDALSAHPGMICTLTHDDAPAGTFVRLERVKGTGRQSVQCTAREFYRSDFAWPYDDIDAIEMAEAAGITDLDGIDVTILHVYPISTSQVIATAPAESGTTPSYQWEWDNGADDDRSWRGLTTTDVNEVTLGPYRSNTAVHVRYRYTREGETEYSGWVYVGNCWTDKDENAPHDIENLKLVIDDTGVPTVTFDLPTGNPLPIHRVAVFIMSGETRIQNLSGDFLRPDLTTERVGQPLYFPGVYHATARAVSLPADDDPTTGFDDLPGDFVVSNSVDYAGQAIPMGPTTEDVIETIEDQIPTTVAPDTTSINLSTAPVTGADCYEWQYSLSRGDALVWVTGVTTDSPRATITGLPPSTPVQARVRAIDKPVGTKLQTGAGVGSADIGNLSNAKITSVLYSKDNENIAAVFSDRAALAYAATLEHAARHDIAGTPKALTMNAAGDAWDASSSVGAAVLGNVGHITPVEVDVMRSTSVLDEDFTDYRFNSAGATTGNFAGGKSLEGFHAVHVVYGSGTVGQAPAKVWHGPLILLPAVLPRRGLDVAGLNFFNTSYVSRNRSAVANRYILAIYAYKFGATRVIRSTASGRAGSNISLDAGERFGDWDGISYSSNGVVSFLLLSRFAEGNPEPASSAVSRPGTITYRDDTHFDVSGSRDVDFIGGIRFDDTVPTILPPGWKQLPSVTTQASDDAPGLVESLTVVIAADKTFSVTFDEPAGFTGTIDHYNIRLFRDGLVLPDSSPTVSTGLMSSMSVTLPAQTLAGLYHAEVRATGTVGAIQLAGEWAASAEVTFSG